MRKQYRYTFQFVRSEQEARQICAQINKGLTYYMRKHHPAHYTPYNCKDSEYSFVVLYYV